MFCGKELKVYRIIKNIKAKEIAEKLSVTKAYISMMENNKREVPLHLYEKWVEILGMDHLNLGGK